MREIDSKKIRDAIADLCIKANFFLRKDVLASIKQAYAKETSLQAKDILQAIIDNAKIARKEELAICQDTGMPCVYIEIGQNVKITGDLKKAINKGVELGYKKGSLRNSVIIDPLLRGSSGYSPAVIHFDYIPGDKIKVTVLAKGFGCENKSLLKMFRPTASIEEIKKFIVEAVKIAGPDACPPYVIGVGIGGTAESASFLAKKALLKKVTRSQGHKVTRLERELLDEINKLNIGPMGLGGKTTALAVNIETYPTHIAGLPVAVSISCHALRSATKIL
ncbi:MAG: fumarate hydratase [Candidatus Omnitrophica bacterium]|nr:fumarate hydratase [Candidatus Omnitrophota bacterium]